MLTAESSTLSFGDDGYGQAHALSAASAQWQPGPQEMVPHVDSAHASAPGEDGGRPRLQSQ
ncbi:MAG TPA: hypothetical protein VF316_01170, partial [Polyangiaceae bacterium]